MNIFSIVREVLDELYVKIQPESDRDSIIKNRIEMLARNYANLSMGANINYRDEATRFAYVFKYVTAHTSIILKTFKDCRDIYNKFGGDHLKITCLGGGPGTDLLAVLKLMTTNGLVNNVTFFLLDREASWQDSWSDISEKLGEDANFRWNMIFTELDVEDREDWFKTQRYLDADIFVSSFFFSELYRIRDSAKSFFIEIAERMKPGAIFVYIDNDSAIFNTVLNEMRVLSGLEIIHEVSRRGAVLEPDEQKDILQDYIDKFRYPRLTADVKICILRKI